MSRETAICTLCRLKNMNSIARCTICGILNSKKYVEKANSSIRTAFEKLQREAMYKELLIEKSKEGMCMYDVFHYGRKVIHGNFNVVKVYVENFTK